MRKSFIYIIVSLFLLIPIAYSGFWYYAAWKMKNFLVGAVSHINNEDSEVSYELSGFPFNFIFHIKNLKLLDEQFNTYYSSENILIKNKLFDKSLYVYIPNYVRVPNNEFNIVIKESIKCQANSDNRFIVKLNDLPFLLRPNVNGSVMDYIDTLRYEDYGSECSSLSGSNGIITEINNKNNHVQLSWKKESGKNAKVDFDSYIYRIVDITNPEKYLSIDTKFHYEFVSDISASSINFDIEKFLIQNDKFSFAANGRIWDYNLVTSSFKDKVDVSILNYKEFISFIIGEESIAEALQKLTFVLSEKATDNDVQFTIRYDDDVGSPFIGKLPTAGLIDQLNKMSQVTKDESSD